MKFQSDLKFGQIYEKEFIKIMGFQTYKHETSKAIKEYDIIVKYNAQTSIEFETKYEIKADRLSYKTGNVCIEIANCGRPSGITSTKSDYWGYFVIQPDGYDLYLIPTEELKQMVNPKNYKVIRGGDGKKSELILIPIRHLKKFKYISQHKEYL